VKCQQNILFLKVWVSTLLIDLVSVEEDSSTIHDHSSHFRVMLHQLTCTLLERPAKLEPTILKPVPILKKIPYVNVLIVFMPIISRFRTSAYILNIR
jgi:hypothetical protein